MMSLIDYSDFIAERTRDFTGREWAFRSIDAWLTDENKKNFYLITGGPGSGKSALAARLVQVAEQKVIAEKAPHLNQVGIVYAHFCQAFDDRTLSPLRFVEGLAQALGDRVPGFSDVLSKLEYSEVNIQVKQNINKVKKHGKVIGVSIETVQIGNLSARVSFDRLVRQPLEQVCASKNIEPIIILVDALDEALTFHPDENIVSLLSQVLRHPSTLPSQVRILLTSRPDPRVLDITGPASLTLGTDAPEEEEDVESYVQKRLEPIAKSQRPRLMEKVLSKGEGNFLYARYMIDEILQRDKQNEDLSDITFPAGLDDIYRQFLRRELWKTREQWSDRYRPLLGVLAVARGDGLTREELGGITGLKLSKVDDVLDACSQYLIMSVHTERFRIYHQSFREFILCEKRFRVYPDEANQALGDYFFKLYQGNWKECQNEYALRYTSTHLIENILLSGNTAEQSCRDELVNKLTRQMTHLSYLQARLGLEKGNTYELEQEFSQVCDLLPIAESHEVFRAFSEALSRESHVLRHSPDMLSIQLYNRLYRGDNSVVDQLLQDSLGELETPCLLSLFALPFDSGLKRTFIGHSETAPVVDITSDGKLAASGSWDNTVRLWNVEEGYAIRVWQTKNSVEQIKLSDDGKQILWYEDENRIVLWDVESGKQFWSRRAGSLSKFAVSSDWHWLLTAKQSRFQLIDITNGEIYRDWEDPDVNVSALAISPDNHMIIAGCADGSIRNWEFKKVLSQANTEPVTVKKKLPQKRRDNEWHGDKAIRAIAVSEDGRWVAAGTDNGKLKMWDLLESKMHWERDADSIAVKAVAISDKNNLVMSGGVDSTIRLWDLNNGELVGRYWGHTGHVMDMRVANNGRWLLTAGGAGQIKLWDLIVFKQPQALHQFKEEMTAIAVSSNGKTAAIGGKNGQLHLVNLESGDSSSLSHHKGEVNVLAFAGDNSVLSSATDSTLKFWNIETNTELFSMKLEKLGERHLFEDLTALHLITTNDNSRAMITDNAGMLSLCDLGEAKLIRFMQFDNYKAMAMTASEDGKYAYVSIIRGDVQKWDVMGGKKPCKIFKGGDKVDVLSVSPDNKYLYGGDIGGDVIQWDCETGEVIDRLRDHINYVHAMTITPDGRYLISAGWDRVIRLWDLKTREVIRRYTWELPVETMEAGIDGENIRLVLLDKIGNVLFLKLV